MECESSSSDHTPGKIQVLCNVPCPPFLSAGLISIYHRIASVEERRRHLDVHSPYECGNRGKDDPPVATILAFDIDDIPQQDFLLHI
jgi:hypothetical protein